MLIYQRKNVFMGVCACMCRQTDMSKNKDGIHSEHKSTWPQRCVLQYLNYDIRIGVRIKRDSHSSRHGNEHSSSIIC